MSSLNVIVNIPRNVNPVISEVILIWLSYDYVLIVTLVEFTIYEVFYYFTFELLEVLKLLETDTLCELVLELEATVTEFTVILN